MANTAETGFVEGRNVAIEYRWLEGHNDRLQEMVADLVRRRVAVIATPNNTASALAAKAATQTIPIVFNIGSDPVAMGLVSTLSHPGRNATGVTMQQTAVTAKRLELLHELVPTASSIAMLVNPGNPRFAETEANEAQQAARALGTKPLADPLVPAVGFPASDRLQSRRRILLELRDRPVLRG
jgi:putative ABC transport system substrate-binding protein